LLKLLKLRIDLFLLLLFLRGRLFGGLFDYSLDDLLLLLLEHHFECLLIELGVPLDHELLEGNEVLYRHDLTHYLLMLRVGMSLVTCLQELLLGDLQLCHQLTEQLIHNFLELLKKTISGG
jgi:hypothetical protein